MKQVKKFIIFLLFALFFTIIGYEYPMIIEGPKKYVKFHLKNAGFKDSFINKKEDIIELNNQKDKELNNRINDISGNSFKLNYKKLLNFDGRTAGFFVSSLDAKKKSFDIYLQDGRMINKDNVTEVNLPFNISFEKNGGVKSVFSINEKRFLLISSKKNFNCYYSSIFSISTSETLLATDCLPDYENVDFNGIGGAFVEIKDGVILSIGAPEWNSEDIRSLAQDTKNIYGKFIIFKKKPFLDNEIILNQDYEIFSSGHKNPQGIVKVEDKLISVEHGPQGGDEINIINQGRNYGWPLVSFGTQYNDGKSFRNAGNNFEKPVFSFLPSIAPSSVNKCPNNLKRYYENNHCVLILSLRGMSLFVALIDKKKLNLVSIEKFEIGQRLRHFGLNSNNLLFQKDDSFFISVDNEGIYEISFSDFR